MRRPPCSPLRALSNLSVRLLHHQSHLQEPLPSASPSTHLLATGMGWLQSLAHRNSLDSAAPNCSGSLRLAFLCQRSRERVHLPIFPQLLLPKRPSSRGSSLLHPPRGRRLPCSHHSLRHWSSQPRNCRQSPKAGKASLANLLACLRCRQRLRWVSNSLCRQIRQFHPVVLLRQRLRRKWRP